MKRKLALIPGKIHQRFELRPTFILLAWIFTYVFSNATGPVLLNPLPVVAPSNDNVCNAIPLTIGAACNGYAYTTIDATLEPNEPQPVTCFSATKTVWFSFVAPPSGYVKITTTNASPGVEMGRAVYYPYGLCNHLDSLILLNCSDDQYTNSTLSCGLLPGETFYIQVAANTAPFEDDFCIEITEETLANAGPDQVLCNVTSTTLAGNAPVFSEGFWSVVSGSATITDPYSPTSGVTGLVPGTTAVLEWNIGFCFFETYFGSGKDDPLGLPDYTSSDIMTITVHALPTTANAGGDREVCDTIDIVLGNFPFVGTGLWSVVSGTATISNPTLPTTNVTGLVPSTVATLQWTITNGTCPPSTDQLTISVLTEPDAGPDQQLCTDINTTTLAANPINIGIGWWSVISGIAIIDDYTSPTTSVTLTPGVPTAFEWLAFFGGESCDRRDTMMITWNDAPSASDAGPDQVLCNQTSTNLAANAPVDGIGTWDVVSGTATIADPSSPSSEITGLIPGTSVILEWTISNGVCTPNTDEVMISVDELPMAEAGPYQQTLCGEFTTTLTGNTPMTGVGIWTVASGTAMITDPTSPTSEVTGLLPAYSSALLKWTITNGSCVSVDSIYLVEREVPIANAGMDQQLCNVTSTVVSANPFVCSDGMMGCETGLWTVTDACGNSSNMITIADPTSPTTNVTDLEPGCSYTLQWNLYSDGGFCSASDEVIITIDELPTLADAGADQTLCDQTTTFLAGNTPSVGIGEWSLIYGFSSITDPGSPTSEVTGLVPGSIETLTWTISNGICPASVDEMTITMDDLPTVADAGADQELCDQTSTNLAANTPLIGMGVWTVITGTATITDPSSPTTEVTGLVNGTVELEWRITNGVCAPTLDTVTLTIYANPDISLAGPDQHLCNQSNTTLAANTPVYGNGLWSVESGTANILNPTSASSGVTGLVAGSTTVLQWTISNGSCIESTDQMTIIVDELPTSSNAGPDQQFCNLTTTTLAGNNPAIGSGLWSVASGTANISNPSSPTSGVTGLVPGTTAILEWTITNGVCSPSVDQVMITSHALPTVSNAGPDQQLCNLASTTLAANTAVVGNGIWTVVSGVVNITNPSSPVSGVTGLLSDASVVLRWTITNGTCPPSIDEVTITVHALPSASNAGPDQQLCNQTTTTLAANTPGIGTGQWSLISGTANITTVNSPTSGVTGLVPGTTAILAWTITNGTCPANVDQVSITVYAPPTTSNAGPDQQLCNQTTTTLAANTPVIGSGLWSVISGTANITNPASPISGVTGLVNGSSVILRWTISNGTCVPSFDQMTITTFALPTPSNAGPDKELCNQSTTSLSGNVPITGTGLWTVISGTASITNPSSPVSGVTGLVPGTSVVVQWSITNGVCPPSTDQMTITIYELPTPSNAGPDQQLCNVSTTSLVANVPIEGVGEWSVVSGSATVTDPTSPTSGVTGLEPGTVATLQWTITNGTCPPSMDQMKIRVYELPSPADAGPDKFLCDQSATIVNAEIPIIGTGVWTVINGTATVIPDDQPTAAVLSLVTGTTTTLQWSVTNGTCPPSIDQLNITVNDFPTQSNAGPDQVVCQSTTTYLQGNEPEVGVGYWLKLSGPGEIADPESPTSEITGLQPGFPTIAQWTIWNGFCQPSSDEVTIIINENFVQADAGPDQYVCGESSVSLTGNLPVFGTGHWTIVEGIATINNSTDPNAEVTDLESGNTVVLEWTITNGDCPSSSDQMSIFTDVSIGLANAGPDLSFCTDEMIMVEGNMPSNGNGVWTIISGIAELLNANQPIAQVQNFIPGTSIVLQWTVTNDGCLPDSDQVVITFDAVPTVAEAGLDLTICETSSLQLSANTPLLGIGSWSVVSGNAMISDTSSPSAMLSGLTPGTTTVLEWSIGNGSCPLSVDQLSIQVDALPSISDAGSDQVLCDQISTTLAANTPLIGEGSWTILDGSGILEDPLSPSTSINNLQPGSTVTLQWTVTNGVCLESSDLMTIEVNHETSLSNAGPDQVLCGEASTILQANTPEYGQGEWTIVNGNALITDPLSPITEVSDLQPGTTVTLLWTITNGICASTTDEVSIQINEAPSTADAGSNQVLCDQTESIVNANAPAIGTGQWEVISGSGLLNDLSQPTTTITGLSSASPLVLQWVTTYGSCESRDTITISTHDLPTAANAGDDQVICTTETMLNANAPLIGQGTWSVVSGAGVLADISSPTTSITGLIPGTLLVLQWNIVNGVCPWSSDEVSVWVETEPVAIAGEDQHLCNETITSIQAFPANVGTGTWTILSGSGNIQDPSAESTFVTGLLPGTTILRWMVSGTACPPAHDDIVITIDAMPIFANAGPDETICSSDFMLSAQDPDVGTGIWTILSGSGSLQNQFDPSTLLMDLTGGISIMLEWKITNGICPSIADTITITTSSLPDTPMASDDQVLCNSDHAILAGNHPNPGSGIGTWSLLSGAGVIENVNDTITTVTGLAIGTNVFVWTIANGACAPLSDTIIIQNNDHAELNSNFLVSEFACAGDTVHMFDISGNATLPTSFFWDFGDNTTSTERDPVHVYTQQGEYTITMTTELEGCGAVSTSKIIRVFNCLSNNPGNGGTRKVLYANVVPNPSDEDFKVSIKLREESEVIITLFDAVGRITETRKIVDETDIKEIFQVEVSGLYFFQIQVGLEVLIFKVVKV